MREARDPLQAACRRARWAGALLGVGVPVLAGAAAAGGMVAPGVNPPEGAFLQVGHAFTGLVFLAAAWILWRRGQVLAGFRTLPEARRAPVVLRETLVYSALAGTSSLLGLAYWGLVGRGATRHALGFMLLGPLLFLALVPRSGAWRKALGGHDEASGLML